MAFGRKLPRNDFEGDDFTPGAGGHYVTCTDTAAGRMVAWATNGRIDKDGKVYRAAAPGVPSGGLTLPQVAVAVHRVADLMLVIPSDWHWPDVLAWLKKGGGLVIQGHYAAIPRAYRYQAFADFNHAMWASHYSPSSGVRDWDPLNPDTTAYGRWVPLSVIRDFTLSLGYVSVGYVPLQPL
jgi:hypothetical protein